MWTFGIRAGRRQCSPELGQLPGYQNSQPGSETGVYSPFVDATGYLIRENYDNPMDLGVHYLQTDPQVFREALPAKHVSGPSS